MTHLIYRFKDEKTLVDTPTPELAGYLLESLVTSRQSNGHVWNRRNYCSSVSQNLGATANELSYSAGIAVSAAWSWLESNGLICPDPIKEVGWYVATKRGKELASRNNFGEIVSNQQLPEEFLHPELLVNARPLYLQGRFDTAVFEAFKSLEVAIRSAASLGDDAIGVQLASKAFHPEDGTLTDKTMERGERVALMSLMAGAIGSYKNPSSHRKVKINATEARDMLILASHLLNIVEQRKIERKVNAT